MWQQNETMERLWQASKHGDAKKVGMILETNPNDVVFELDEYGELINLAMSQKNLAALVLLIEFYVRNEIEEAQEGTEGAIAAEQKLEVMLESAYESSSNESDELKDIMSKYTSKPNYSVMETLSTGSILSLDCEKSPYSTPAAMEPPETMSLTIQNVMSWIEHLETQKSAGTTTSIFMTWHDNLPLPNEYLLQSPDEIAQSSQLDIDLVGNVIT